MIRIDDTHLQAVAEAISKFAVRHGGPVDEFGDVEVVKFDLRSNSIPANFIVAFAYELMNGEGSLVESGEVEA